MVCRLLPPSLPQVYSMSRKSNWPSSSRRPTSDRIRSQFGPILSVFPPRVRPETCSSRGFSAKRQNSFPQALVYAPAAARTFRFAAFDETHCIRIHFRFCPVRVYGSSVAADVAAFHKHSAAARRIYTYRRSVKRNTKKKKYIYIYINGTHMQRENWNTNTDVHTSRVPRWFVTRYTVCVCVHTSCKLGLPERSSLLTQTTFDESRE